jgi:di/tricarboxylate transporter
VLRIGLLTVVAIIPAAVQQGTLWAADVAPSDPTSFLPSLGIGGAVAALLYLWLRTEQKRGDRLEARVAEMIPVIQKLSSVVEASVDATKASTDAMEEMTKMMEYRWPTRRSS